LADAAAAFRTGAWAGAWTWTWAGTWAPTGTAAATIAAACAASVTAKVTVDVDVTVPSKLATVIVATAVRAIALAKPVVHVAVCGHVFDGLQLPCVRPCRSEEQDEGNSRRPENTRT
jgi:hypothetical protein